MRKLLLFSVAATLAFVVTPALAQPTVDNFNISVVMSNEFFSGGGTGFSDGTGMGNGEKWYYYENTDWYNQWFYDAPPNPMRYKEITYDITLFGMGAPTELTELTVALNWSTLAYSETGPDGPPPLPPLTSQQENDWIVREVLFDDFIDGYVNITGTFVISDYNPEWVSIDVRAYGDEAFAYTYVYGTITHECIPIVLGSIDIDPDTLNLKSKGKWITCYIELPEGYDVQDIDKTSVVLKKDGFEVGGEYGEFQTSKLMVKFPRSEVQNILEPGEVELTVTGELTDGTKFKGSDTIRVIDKGGKE